ncbi:hypothetical protein AURDEDRAFT_184063 [Auricularia subglabra TFB-10046 SS5]|nr:hypothetical protein AURDEDRAFT_184063 [Auricularia subglabra TFB-10046 SS5]
MAAPVFWKQPTHFYAFGNTPAHSVAQYLEPDDPANFLLLGCGDVRNVLYTVYASGADSPNAARIMDFTCNDAEPAVLARNAILYSLLHEDLTLMKLDQIWSIYYHMKLDAASLALLYSQCEKLHKASESTDLWAASPFAAYIKVASEHSLNELHRLFGLFLSTKPRLAQLTKTFTAAIRKKYELTRKQGVISTPLRAAGPAFVQFNAETACRLHESYWTTGLAAPDPAAKHANPTVAFALSGEPFPLHRGSTPCLGFDLFEPIANGKDVYDACRAQFRAWCGAFAKASAAGRVVVRFCVSDAFALCRALARGSSDGLFVAQWGNAPLKIHDDCPRRFAAIDTSNLVDSLGLINVLLLAKPLLEDSPRAVLYTESLAGSAGDAVKGVRAALCGELSAMTLLLNLTPAPYLDGLASHSDTHHIMRARMPDEGGSHERLAWRRPPAADALLRFDPAELAELLCTLHYELFRAEDGAALRAQLQTRGPQAALRLLQNVVYVRGTFVALLAQLRARLHPDTAWRAVAGAVLPRAGGDRRLMIGDCSYQDLCVHLQASGLADVVPAYAGVPGRAIDAAAGPLAGWPRDAIGKTVYAALRVPVSAFDKLDGIEPVHELFFATRTPTALNYFATFSAFRGGVAQAGTSFDVQPSDAQNADVIAVALVPAWLIMDSPGATTLSITVRPGNLQGQKLFERLGMKLEVFSASVLDTKSAFFSSGPPVVNGVRLAPLYDAPAIPESSDSGRPVVTVALDARKASVATLMLRSDVEGDDERAQWTARVDVKAVQTSPYEAFVQTVCGTFKRRLCFPLPVDVRKAKLRVARKSFYVETIVPIAQTVTHSVQSMRGLFHTVALDRLPKFGRQKPGWLDMHIQFAFSDVELANRNKYLNTRDPGRIPWADVKDDLYSLLMRSAGFQNPVRVFALADASKADAVYAVLFVAALRIDGPGSTIVADAYVLPVAEGAKPPSVAMGALSHPPAMAALWRRLLVGFTERCRAWVHAGSCARPDDAICGCGAGADVAGFKEWVRYGVRPAEVTRAAISLPFAPHFVEGVGGHMPDFATMAAAARR